MTAFRLVATALLLTGTAVGRAIDSTLGTNTTGTNPTGTAPTR